jgi:hypothetical protein
VVSVVVAEAQLGHSGLGSCKCKTTHKHSGNRNYCKNFRCITSIKQLTNRHPVDASDGKSGEHIIDKTNIYFLTRPC